MFHINMGRISMAALHFSASVQIGNSIASRHTVRKWKAATLSAAAFWNSVEQLELFGEIQDMLVNKYPECMPAGQRKPILTSVFMPYSFILSFFLTASIICSFKDNFRAAALFHITHTVVKPCTQKKPKGKMWDFFCLMWTWIIAVAKLHFTLMKIH